MLAILILAAGKSTRMGGTDKLLEVVNGGPLLREITKRACRADIPTYVCIPPNSADRRLALEGLPVSVIVVDDAAQGMAHSLRAGICALPPNISAVAILPADMPELTDQDLIALKKANQEAPNAILRGASSQGKPGHPVIFPRDMFDALAKLGGDNGARSIVQQFNHRLQLVLLPDDHALVDLDTPQEWEEWRKTNK